ncbi:lipid A core, O-antigen ligase family enzyme [Gloeomargarita lithophora Alchichica-D10]|uniref:Lipid A core, O-antigen ligase family enzyme n=1 Tax=Gloeomargarita lithophora Alchichica-D10 TaxID=1188229 RepID=A0A1J0ACE7_9CYAN|nr:O-antigen ligase family protein [Gloeomargarita lithophora]APB33612.1 lipid A core, O-antigen ligase family enzyme [Gloeomargarita lithophora Alchichica-D10]
MGTRLDWLGLGLGILPFWSGLGLAVWAGGMISVWVRRGRLLCRQRETWLWVGLTGLMVISSLQSPDPLGALLGLGNFVPFFAFFLAVRSQVTPAQRYQWVKIMGGTGMVVALVGLAQALGGQGTLTLLGLEMNWHSRIPGRVDSVFSDANVMASYCVMLLPVQLGLTLNAPSGSRLRWGWGVATGITFLALLLTRSLNGLGVVGLLGIGVSFRQRRYVLSAVIVLLGLGIVGAGLDWPGWRAVFPELLWGRLPKYLLGRAEDLRTVQWQLAWDWFEQRPWWGWGLRYFPTLYQQSTDSWVGHPHNFWVMLLVETGVWVTGLFTFLVGRVVVRGWHSWHKTGDWRYGGMWLAFVGVTCFHGLDVTLFDGRVNGLAWLLLAGLADDKLSSQSGKL